MGFLKGSQTFTIYRTTQPAPKDALDMLLHHAHQPRPDARTKEPNLGWVAIDDDTHAPDLPHFGDALAFACRIDRKRVPARALKLAVQARQREVMQERGVERLGKNHKQEIAEAVEEDLLSRALPTITTVDVLWTNSEVYVFTPSATTADLVRALFLDTFGVRLYPDRLGDWLADATSWGEAERLCRARLPGGSAAGGRAHEVNHEGWHENDPFGGQAGAAASAFLDALVKSDGEDDGLRLDGKAVFSCPDEAGVSRTTLAGTINPGSLETVDAVGQHPTLARFGLRIGEAEYGFTLKVADHGIAFAAVKLPTVVKDGTEEMVLERAYLLGLLVAEVRRRFVQHFAPGVAKKDAENEGDGAGASVGVHPGTSAAAKVPREVAGLDGGRVAYV